MALTRDDIHGLEYDWLSIDSEGFVGFFSTAGAGAVPDAFLDDAEAYQSAVEALLAMAAVGGADCGLSLPEGYRNDWCLLAQRGLFSYDSNPNGGPYQRVAVPETPVKVDSLPAAIRGVAQRIVLRSIRFRDCPTLTEANIRD